MIRILAFIFALIPTLAFSGAVKVKDLVSFSGMRGNDLVGYGIVIGLNGTGDSVRSAPYTAERLAGLLGQFGVATDPAAIKPKNVAAVLITAELPAFARSGDRIDVKVSAIGDAKSLRGGTLAMTTLSAADGQIYAVAQGSVIAGGYSAEGRRESVTQGVPTSGSVPGGARVEREVDFRFEEMDRLTLSLRQVDFSTAIRIEKAVNGALGRGVATAIDAGTVEISSNALGSRSLSRAAAVIGDLTVTPEAPARVVLDTSSGTVIIDRNVRLSTVAVSHGGLTIRIKEDDLVSQPSPFTAGETVVVPMTTIDASQGEGGLAVVRENSSLDDLVAGLNALGVKSEDLIHILKSIDAAGALHAELVIR